MNNLLLHEDILQRTPIVGQVYHQLLTNRVEEVHDGTRGIVDPDVTVMVRTRNHEGRIGALLDDLDKQLFSGAVQVVLVDTESTDNTVRIATAGRDTTVRSIHQASFNYPHSLNVGFEAADHPFVVTLVGHSRLTNKLALRSIARWGHRDSFGGAYGVALPDSTASLGDLAISLLQRNYKRLAPAEKIEAWQPGAMVAHRSVVRRDAWEELGGYDEAFGNGGEDTDFAKRLIVHGLEVIREPALSVHHSYGLGLRGTLRHIAKLRRLRTAANPEQFDQRLLAYRPDMQQAA